MTLYWRRLAVSFVVLLGVTAALLSVALTAPAVDGPEHSAFHQGAGNLSNWRAGVEESGTPVQVVLSDTALLDVVSEGTDALVVLASVPRSLTVKDAGPLQNHLDRGGSVWVAESEGRLNQWLSQHGIAVQGSRLLDARSTNPQWVNATAQSSAEGPVTMQSPSSLLVNATADWQVLLSAPAQVHLDVLDDGVIDATDRPGPHVVAARRTFPSGGLLIVSADSSMLTDAVLASEATDNTWATRTTIQEALPDGGLVVVDETRSGWTPREAPLAQATQFLAAYAYGNPLVVWLAFGSIVAIVALAIVASPRLEPFKHHERHDPIVPPDDAARREVMGLLPGGSSSDSIRKPPARGRQPSQRPTPLQSSELEEPPNPDPGVETT